MAGARGRENLTSRRSLNASARLRASVVPSAAPKIVRSSGEPGRTITSSSA